MLPRRAVIRFSVIAIAVYAALTWGWPTFDHLYAAHFRLVGNTAFSQFWFWSDAQVDFHNPDSETLRSDVVAKLPGVPPEAFKVPKPQGVKDTLMVLKNRRVPSSVGFLYTSCRLIGYTPTAVLLSLVLATPIVWKRRLWLLFWGAVTVHVAIVVRLTALLLDAGFADPSKKYALFHPGTVTADIIHRARVILADNPTFSYVVAVFLWVLVLFLLQCWYEWRPGRGRNDPKAS